jgi:hypothetical protein
MSASYWVTLVLWNGVMKSWWQRRKLSMSQATQMGFLSVRLFQLLLLLKSYPLGLETDAEPVIWPLFGKDLPVSWQQVSQIRPLLFWKGKWFTPIWNDPLGKDLLAPVKDLLNASSTNIVHVIFPQKKGPILYQRKYNNRLWQLRNNQVGQQKDNTL